MSIGDKFKIAVCSGHTVAITDQRLATFSDAEINNLARDLLQKLPFEFSLSLIASKRLKGRIKAYRKVFFEIAMNLKVSDLNILKTKDLVPIPSVYSGIKASDFLSWIKRMAILSMDLVYSFPQWYPKHLNVARVELTDPPSVSANQLFNFVDHEMVINQPDYLRFLHKKIAYFERDKGAVHPVCFARAIEAWAQKGGKVSSQVKAFVGDGGYGFVDPYIFPENVDTTSQIFRAFIYEKTLGAFEEPLGEKVPDFVREDLIKKMKDEEFRMTLVFYSAFPDQMKDQDLTDERDATFYLSCIRIFHLLKKADVIFCEQRPQFLERLFRLNPAEINDILAHLQNNIRYIRLFFEEYTKLTLDEKFAFLRGENPPLSEAQANENVRSCKRQAEMVEAHFRQSPYGSFLIACKLASKPDILISDFLRIMKGVEDFTKAPFPTDLVARLIVCNLPLKPFEEMFRVYVDQRKILRSHFHSKGGEIPQECKDAILQATDEFDKVYWKSAEGSHRKEIIENFFDHFLTGIVCTTPEPLTAIIGSGTAKQDHYLTSFKDEEDPRKICAGWRIGKDEYPIFDLSLVHTQDFRSFSFSVPLKIQSPPLELYTYLSQLGNYYLALFGGDDLPDMPEQFEKNSTQINDWMDEVSCRFQIAVLDMAIGNCSQEAADKDPSPELESIWKEEGDSWELTTNKVERTLSVIYPKNVANEEEKRRALSRWQAHWFNVLYT